MMYTLNPAKPEPKRLPKVCVAGAPQSEPTVDNVQSLGARFARPQPPLFKIS